MGLLPQKSKPETIATITSVSEERGKGNLSGVRSSIWIVMHDLRVTPTDLWSTGLPRVVV